MCAPSENPHHEHSTHPTGPKNSTQSAQTRAETRKTRGGAKQHPKRTYDPNCYPAVIPTPETESTPTAPRGPEGVRKPSDEPKMIRLISRLLSAFRAARPRRKQRSAKTSGILFDRMFALLRATSVPFSRLARRFELMTIMVQPLQIRKRVIVTRHDVVTVITYPVAQRRMHARLAMIMRALANHGTDGSPVPGQPIPPVTPIPSTHARPRSTTTPAPWPTRHHEEHTQQPAPNMASTIEYVRGSGRVPRLSTPTCGHPYTWVGSTANAWAGAVDTRAGTTKN